MKQIQWLVMSAYKTSYETIIVRHEQVPPTWLFTSRDNKLTIVYTPWQNDREKEMTEVELRKYIKRENPTAYASVTEAWMSKPASYGEWVRGGKPRPSQDPARMEMLIISAVEREGDWLFKAWQMIRNHEEIVTRLEPYKMDEEPPESWMMDLFRESKNN